MQKHIRSIVCAQKKIEFWTMTLWKSDLWGLLRFLITHLKRGGKTGEEHKWKIGKNKITSGVEKAHSFL